MAYIYFCNNPKNKCTIGDCVIRAISKALDATWESVYIDLVMEGYLACDMPSSNNVWGAYLYSKNFNKKMIPHYGYTVKDFCAEHPVGTYILGTGTHAITVKDGNYFDTWNSGDEVISFYWEREEER